MRLQPKTQIVISQASTTNAATASGTIDTLGAHWLTLDVVTSTSNAVTNNPSVLKLSECDTTDGTFTDITKFVGDGTGGFTIPNSVTTGDWLVKFNVALPGRKRYLKLSVSPLTTQTITAIANLWAEEAPITAANTGSAVKAVVEG